MDIEKEDFGLIEVEYKLVEEDIEFNSFFFNKEITVVQLEKIFDEVLKNMKEINGACTEIE